MFKKAFQVATAFGVLLAAYAGYVRVFALVASAVSPAFQAARPFVRADSRSEREARDLAVKAFGAGHWATAENLQIRINNAERGSRMYAENYEMLNDGRRVKFSRFAMIWGARDGKSLKTATSDSAYIDLDQPLTMTIKPGASNAMHVIHARLEGDVRIRDDEGTASPLDDLVIHGANGQGMSFIDYDEKRLEIVSDSDVEIEKGRTYWIGGTGFRIALRPNDDKSPGASSGFPGAEAAFLNKNVHIKITDVGPSGILPGNPKAVAVKGEPTPLDLRADGSMRIDLPRPRLDPVVGPPAPKGPTLAHFYRNVDVRRGKPGTAPDQLTCDELHLTLVPPDKDAKAKDKDKAQPAATVLVEARPGPIDPNAPPVEEPVADSGMSDLTLQRAAATGHNVRLVSAGQGVVGRGNELIHAKNMPFADDETYFRGDPTNQLLIEKTNVASEGPEKGKVTSFDTIRTSEVTIFDDGRGNEYAKIFARGPGILESRTSKEKPVDRSARWHDQLVIQPELPPDARTDANGKLPPPRKRITLSGDPNFSDFTSKSTLDARRVIVVWLKPKPQPAAPKQGATRPAPVAEATPSGSSFDVDMLVALDTVRLNAPAKSLNARDRLDVVFTNIPETTPAPRPGAPTVVNVAPTTPAAAAPANPPAPTKPAELASRASANTVWASLILKPGTDKSPAPSATPAPGLFGASPAGGGRQTEIDKLYMRGSVRYHQDPEPGKEKGTDVAAEALDLFNVGDQKNRMIVFHRDPSAKAAEARLAPGTGSSLTLPKAAPAPAANDDLAPLARVENDEMTIRGKVIGLDQSTDQAWVDGRGSMTQMASAGLLTEKAPDPKKAADDKAKGKAPAAPAKRSPMTITFANGMKFFGKSVDLNNRPAARAEFFRDIYAETDESTLACQDVMRVYFDRTIKLARPPREATPPKVASTEPADPDFDETKPKEPKPEIALIECVSDVIVVNRKFDPVNRWLVQKQRIEGEYLVYEKSTGFFRIPGGGDVYLYEREGQQGLVPKALGANDRPTSDRQIIRTAGPATSTSARPGTPPTPATNPVAGARASSGARANGRGVPVVGSNSVRGPSDLRSRDRVKEKMPDLILTEVTFSREMHGRFGTGKDTDNGEIRWANFFGEVQAYRAKVANEDVVIDPDAPPADFSSISSQILQVVSEPLPPKGNATERPARNLLRAWDTATAATADKTIQADRITFNSETNLFYAYGDDGRNVLLSQQMQQGQPASVGEGSAAMLNLKTGQAQLVDPRTFAMFDAKSAYRPQPEKYKPEKLDPKRPPRPKFRNLRGNIERKDFNGH